MPLSPKRVIHRKVQRGREKGNATRDNNIDFGGGTSLTVKQVLLWGGVALLGWYLIRKIRGK